jgi:hypothetical protein
MEPKDHKIERGFVSREEAALILDWIEGLDHKGGDPNYHLSELSKELNGKSRIFDISQTEITRYISKFQSVSDVSTEEMPYFIRDIIDRISILNGLSKSHIFLQAVDMEKGGRINPHYDAAIRGYVNYKCNISVLSEDYRFYIGDDIIEIKERDMYCFEASLYKHWTERFESRRAFISIGFMVPYSEVGRDESDPRVRLSNRIEKHFQRFNI